MRSNPGRYSPRARNHEAVFRDSGRGVKGTGEESGPKTTALRWDRWLKVAAVSIVLLSLALAAALVEVAILNGRAAESCSNARMGLGRSAALMGERAGVGDRDGYSYLAGGAHGFLAIISDACNASPEEGAFYRDLGAVFLYSEHTYTGLWEDPTALSSLHDRLKGNGTADGIGFLLLDNEWREAHVVLQDLVQDLRAMGYNPLP